jgi:hypothetical protein
LPSARNPTLGKDPFAVGGFAEWRLPTLGKEFAECKLAFAECNRHSAKPVNPVVNVSRLLFNFFGSHAPTDQIGLHFFVLSAAGNGFQSSLGDL